MFAPLLWWLAVQLLGLAALPLTWRLFARFRGRGYPFAKALGLLLVSYVLWLGAIFHVIPNDVGGILLSVTVVAGVSWTLGRAGWQRDADGTRLMLAWLRAERPLVIATEVLFAVVLFGWSVFRAYNPDIAGTEKPMEFAFINGVLNSRFFPPQDPWLSGYGISYYYFGYVMLGLLIRLTGVDPAVGFNMGVALWYALVMVGAFGVVQMLVERARSVARSETGHSTEEVVARLETGHSIEEVVARSETGHSIRSRASIGWGLLGALFVGFLGNLEGLLDTAYQRGLLPLSLIQWFDIKGLMDSDPTGGWTGGFWWWWRASRVIHDKDLLGNSIEVIDEFPFFSFLLGDLHPHVLALPFVLLAVALAVNLVAWTKDEGWRTEDGRLTTGDGGQGTEGAGAGSGGEVPAGAVRIVSGGVQAPPRWMVEVRTDAARFWGWLGQATGLGGVGIVLYAVALGSLGFLNTWDFPIYLALATLALGAALAWREGLSLWTVVRALLGGVTFAVLGFLLYLPFYIGFQSQLGGLLPNALNPSRFSQFFIMFGPFLVVAVFFLLALSLRGLARQNTISAGVLRSFLVALPWTLLAPVVWFGLVLLRLASPLGRGDLQQVLATPGVADRVPKGAVGELAALIVQLRAATPWTYVVLALLIAWAIGVAWAHLRRGDPDEPGVEASAGNVVLADSHPDRLKPRLRSVAGVERGDVFAVFLIGLALVLAFVPEFLYLRDFFGSRMNTVFKFYYQAWAMLAIAAAYGLSRLSERGTRAVLRIPAVALAVLLTLGGLWYPLAAIPSKADYFRTDPANGDWRPTLDGLAHLRRYNPADMAAIEWLRANVAPTAVVVEATGGSYSAANRVSMATGNPTLLGWDFHERQWRGRAYDELASGRPEALDRIYRTATAEELPGLLAQWNVDYVYIGSPERDKYGVSDAALGRFDAALTKVYDRDGVRIYAR